MSKLRRKREKGEGGRGVREEGIGFENGRRKGK